MKFFDRAQELADLARLEDDYSLIRRHKPLFAKPSSKVARYELNDCFLIFWFRFCYRYSYLLELKGYDQLRRLIVRDYAVFSGHALEEYFRRKFAESGRWTRLGGWWDRKGENELDLVAENELDEEFLVGEVKRDKKRIDLDVVRRKLAAFQAATGEWKGKTPQLVALSIEDM